MENESYAPPFFITSKMLSLCIAISEKLGKLSLYRGLASKPHLRRSQHIKSIHSSLAIEANSLSLEEVKDVIEGHLVMGSRREVLEVKNAYEAYEEIKYKDPYSLKDLKEVHAVMTKGLIGSPGQFRMGNEGVFRGEEVIFGAPPPWNVSNLMEGLFYWMNGVKDELNPLILSSVFYYEFVFIHPFEDGNGRMARLWQTALLAKWNKFFRYLPIESEIEKNQNSYYKAIDDCNKIGNSTLFVEFMLSQIDAALREALKLASSKEGQTSVYVERLLKAMKFGIPYSARDLMEKVEIKSTASFRKNYLEPALELGLIEMTIPAKPTSKNQRYIRR